MPGEQQLTTKGIAIALADGIGSSDVSQLASQCAVKAFLADYYCTPESWSVKTSAERVLRATNSWLESQTRSSRYRDDHDRGYVCTFSAIVIKGTTAHVFHVGDTRVWRLRAGEIEQLSEDHRVRVSRDQSYLGRALGVNRQLEIDYRALPVEADDVFVLTTDGVHDHVSDALLAERIAAGAGDLDAAARELVRLALERGSGDNLTLQIVRIESLPAAGSDEHVMRLSALPLPPPLEARAAFDGYTIVRTLHASDRSHIHLAIDDASGAAVALKMPSIDRRGDAGYLEAFLLEEWVARRIDSPYVLKPCATTRPRSHLYVCFEYIEGRTLAQWMIDHPRPGLDAVRSIVEQIARGLRAFHRLEMLHRDIRPPNVIIDRTGTARIIDFGSTRIAGIAENGASPVRAEMAGTAQYTAPETFLGEEGTPRSDLFSLAVVTYQLLTGRLPYGPRLAQSKSRAEQHKLVYEPATLHHRGLPPWIDGALRKALHVNPLKRHADLDEFVYDLHRPNREFLQRSTPPLIERNPVVFWKGLSLVLAIVVVALVAALLR